VKRSARNTLRQIQEIDGKYVADTFPTKALEPMEEVEKQFAALVSACELRKKDTTIPFSRVMEENNRDLRNMLSLGIPAINILAMCGLFISCIKEVDNELVALRARLDQLEAENSRLSLRLAKERCYSSQ